MNHDLPSETLPSNVKTIGDLRKLGLENNLVRVALSTWEAGGFRTLEECLIALCCLLAEENSNFRSQLGYDRRYNHEDV